MELLRNNMKRLKEKILNHLLKKYNRDNSRQEMEGWYMTADGECLRYPLMRFCLIYQGFMEAHYDNKLLRKLDYKMNPLFQKYNDYWCKKHNIVF